MDNHRMQQADHPIPRRPRVASQTVMITIPTYNRLGGLDRLLHEVRRQIDRLSAPYAVSITVVDNSPDRSAEKVVRAHTETSATVLYLHEPTAGIPHARNACVRAARDCDALIFIDDDEWPADGWLTALLETWRRHGADIVLGPAKGVLPDGSPRWARTSGVFDKDRRLTTGAETGIAYSYNTLVSRAVWERLGPSFDAAFEFTGSSDRHYFLRAHRKGFRTVWAAEALVYEEVPPSRVRLRWLMTRGLRTGAGATLSMQLEHGTVPALPRTVLRAGYHAAWAARSACLFWLPRHSLAAAVHRSAIAIGLLLGLLGWNYAEYERPEDTVLAAE